MNEPAEGQIWRDNDKRKFRLVYVCAARGGWVKVFTCNEDGEQKRGTRATHIDLARFLKDFTFARKP
jgi:hypothetical protein